MSHPAYLMSISNNSTVSTYLVSGTIIR